jgi:hypothetical protein
MRDEQVFIATEDDNDGAQSALNHPACSGGVAAHKRRGPDLAADGATLLSFDRGAIELGLQVEPSRP